MGKRVSILIALLALLLSFLGVHAIGTTDRMSSSFTFSTSQAPPPPDSSASGRQKIYIENVDVWSFDKELNPNAQLLKGNVIFRHRNALMYCDSAYLYEKQNKFTAFENVHINQADSVQIYCNELDYDGLTLMAKLRYNVRLIQSGTTLYTDSLDYDRKDGIGYYAYFGTIADSLNTLSSYYGEYSTVTKCAIFNDSVKLINPNFTLYSDTLHYDTETKLATILGPTRIVSDSGYILATRGVYDTQHEQVYLMDRAKIYSSSRMLTGDSLYYDKKDGIVEMYHRIFMTDTAQKVVLRGNYAEYHEKTQYGYATDSAYIEEYSENDTTFMHAHKIEMIQSDSIHKTIKGLGNVRLYKQNVQATCDSIIYMEKDSIIRCIGRPFMWNESSQINGDTIDLYIKNGQIDRAHIFENANIIRHVKQKYYDQMRGNEIIAYFSNNRIDSVWTKGNAETLYFVQEKDSTVSKQLKTQSSAIQLQFINDELYKIKWLDKTMGVINSINLVKEKELFFPSFIWFNEGRPINKFDIFRETPLPKNGSTGESTADLKPKNPEAVSL